eukprot:CAMPEP_0172595022 /NCGR_PEP_ID=MMETSP1068-20121228/14533_1 /TAXON_ID=35684 /ORGANISM="Pseudopedinella elastica, Strain CCMP716" /LENGTH=409 /DNA_ID=CAMNT_0013393345 /DNA_START=153 /DNA_END=1382 /DNA_ORIENTATION=+
MFSLVFLAFLVASNVFGSWAYVNPSNKGGHSCRRYASARKLAIALEVSGHVPGQSALYREKDGPRPSANVLSSGSVLNRVASDVATRRLSRLIPHAQGLQVEHESTGWFGGGYSRLRCHASKLAFEGVSISAGVSLEVIEQGLFWKLIRDEVPSEALISASFLAEDIEDSGALRLLFTSLIERYLAPHMSVLNDLEVMETPDFESVELQGSRVHLAGRSAFARVPFRFEVSFGVEVAEAQGGHVIRTHSPTIKLDTLTGANSKVSKLWSSIPFDGIVGDLHVGPKLKIEGLKIARGKVEVSGRLLPHARSCIDASCRDDEHCPPESGGSLNFLYNILDFRPRYSYDLGQFLTSKIFVWVGGAPSTRGRIRARPWLVPMCLVYASLSAVARVQAAFGSAALRVTKRKPAI